MRVAGSMWTVAVSTQRVGVPLSRADCGFYMFLALNLRHIPLLWWFKATVQGILIFCEMCLNFPFGGVKFSP